MVNVAKRRRPGLALVSVTREGFRMYELAIEKKVLDVVALVHARQRATVVVAVTGVMIAIVVTWRIFVVVYLWVGRVNEDTPFHAQCQAPSSSATLLGPHRSPVVVANRARFHGPLTR